MSGPGGESPVTREELRREIRKELRETLLAELRDIRSYSAKWGNFSDSGFN